MSALVIFVGLFRHFRRRPQGQRQTDRASRLQPLSVWKSSCIIQLPQSEVQPLLSDCSLAEFVFNHCNLRPLLPWLPWWVIEYNGGLILGLAWLATFFFFWDLARSAMNCRFSTFIAWFFCAFHSFALFFSAVEKVLLKPVWTSRAGVFWLVR